MAAAPKLPEPTADPTVVQALVDRLDKLAAELADIYHHVADLIGDDEARTGRPYPLAHFRPTAVETRRWADELRTRYGLDTGTGRGPTIRQ